MKPVEGTILTVARESSKKAYRVMKKGSTLEDFFKILIDEAHASLGRTPSLLPVLQDAGVVDSGGAGLVYILEGMQKALNGEVIEANSQVALHQPVVNASSFNADSELEYGYCTEFILQLQNKKVNPAKFEDIKTAMNSIGVTGMTVTNVMGCGTQKGHIRKYRGIEIEEMNLNPKMKLEMVVSAVPVEKVVVTARDVLYTGNIGDGKIFIYDVEDAVKVRTGERGYDALQGEDDV